MNNKSTILSLRPVLAILIVMATVILTVSSTQAAKTYNNKPLKTTIRLRTATQIGNTTLSPGEYRVRITPSSNSSGDQTVQFSILHNPYGDDFNPPYDEVVVLAAQASTVALRAPAASTELIPTSADSNKASALEIHGDSTEFVFNATAASGQ